VDSSVVQACPGGASYRVLDDPGMSVEVNGSVPTWEPNSAAWNKLATMWQRWGSAARDSCSRYEVPLTWFMGVMAVESGGNPNACSPCNPDVCCFYPNCQPCCAYGLMQFIDRLAKCYGSSGAELLGNGELAVDLAAQHIAAMIHGEPEGRNCAPGPYGLDLPRVASAYNCGARGCTGSGTFGLCGQHNYSANVVRYANTAAVMGIRAYPGPKLAMMVGCSLAVAGAAAAWSLLSGRQRRLWARVGL